MAWFPDHSWQLQRKALPILLHILLSVAAAPEEKKSLLCSGCQLHAFELWFHNLFNKILEDYCILPKQPLHRCISASMLPQSFGASSHALSKACHEARREVNLSSDDAADRWLSGKGPIKDESWLAESKVQMSNFAVTWCGRIGGSCTGESALWTYSRFLDMCVAFGRDASSCETAYCLLDNGRLTADCTAFVPRLQAPEVMADGDQDFWGVEVLDRTLYLKELRRQADPATMSFRETLPYFPGDWAKPAFLIQVKNERELTPTTLRLEALGAHVFVLTWQEPPKKGIAGRRIFFVKESINEGINALWIAARKQEERQGWVYGYYIFYDEPMLFQRGNFDTFVDFLRRWEPALGAPITSAIGVNCKHFLESSVQSESTVNGSVFSISGIDQQFLAVHQEASDELFPILWHLDFACPYTAQTLQMLMAAVKYKGRVLATDLVVAFDFKHTTVASMGANPSCWRHIHVAREWFIDLLPPDQQQCARFFEVFPGKDSSGKPHGPVLRPPAPTGLQVGQRNVPERIRTGYGHWQVGGLRDIGGDLGCTYDPPDVPLTPVRFDAWAMLAQPAPVFRSPGQTECWQDLVPILSAVGQERIVETGQCSAVNVSDPMHLAYAVACDLLADREIAELLWTYCCSLEFLGLEGNPTCWRALNRTASDCCLARLSLED